MSDIFAKITLLFLNSKRFVIFFYSFVAHLGCFEVWVTVLFNSAKYLYKYCFDSPFVTH